VPTAQKLKSEEQTKASKDAENIVSAETKRTISKRANRGQNPKYFSEFYLDQPGEQAVQSTTENPRPFTLAPDTAGGKILRKRPAKESIIPPDSPSSLLDSDDNESSESESELRTKKKRSSTTAVSHLPLLNMSLDALHGRQSQQLRREGSLGRERGLAGSAAR